MRFGIALVGAATLSCAPPPAHHVDRPKDRIAYYEGLNAARVGHGGTEPDVPDPNAVVQALDEYEHTPDPSLKSELRGWLFAREHDFWLAYVREPDRVGSSASQSLWHHAESAWTDWMNEQIRGALTPSEADHVSLAAGEARAFPGLDRFRAGVALVDLWLRLAPTKLDPDLTDEYALCRVRYDYGKLAATCPAAGGWWYRDARTSDEGRHRLLDVVRARRNPALTRLVILGLGPKPETLAAVEDLDEDPELWRDAVVTAARMEANDAILEGLRAHLVREWHTHPSRRGVVLYALAAASGPFVTPEADLVAKDLGITRANFVDFLGQDPRALELARWLLPARTSGWSAAEAMVPFVDAYLALRPDEPKWPPRGPGVPAALDYVCRVDHDVAGLAKLRPSFEAHDSRMMEPFTPNVCRPRP